MRWPQKDWHRTALLLLLLLELGSSVALVLLIQGTADKDKSRRRVQKGHQQQVGRTLGPAVFVQNKVGIGVGQVLETTRHGRDCGCRLICTEQTTTRQGQ